MVLKTKPSFVPENVIYNPILKSLLISMLEKDPEKRITFIKFYNHPFLTNKNRRIMTGNCRQSMSVKSGLNTMMANLITKPKSKPIIVEKEFNSDDEDAPKIKVTPHFLLITYRMSYRQKVNRIGKTPNFVKPFVMEVKMLSPRRIIVH